MFVVIALVIVSLTLFVWAGCRATPLVAEKRARIVRRAARETRAPRPRKAVVEPGLLVSEVATRLRSGATTEAAWRQALTRLGLVEVGDAELDSAGVPGALRRLWEMSGMKLRKSADMKTGIPPAVAVCRMSYLTGAPTADVLDSCAHGVMEAAEASAGRRVALAGPKASARMLSWLPLVGLGLGIAMEADPIGFLTGSMIGVVCLVVGLTFEVVGILWVRRLAAKAEEVAL
ncbi:MAG: hypothetical protein QM705_10955 [Ancrocorticia sp.]